MKTIKVSEENYGWLLHKVTTMQFERKKKMSFDDALKELRHKERENILKHAGTWSLSDEDALGLINEIYKDRKIISGRLNGLS